MKIGIIGCGMIAKRVYMPIFRSLNLDVDCVCDINEKRLISFAKQFNIKQWFTNHHDMLKRELDLVCVCTPNDSHASITIDAAKSGSNVLVEKPLATNLSDAQNMIKKCNEYGVKICVMHEYRMFSCIQEAKKIINEGRIGNIVSMHIIAHDFPPLSWSPRTWFYKQWGLLEDLGPHIIDIIVYLCDSKLEDVKVISRDYIDNMNCYNHIQSLLLFENKVIVDMDLSWITGAYEFSIKIFGTAGTLNIDVRNDHIMEIHGYSTPLEELYGIYIKLMKTIKSVLSKQYFKGPVYYHNVVIRKFIYSIIRNSDPPITQQESLEVMNIIQSIKDDV